MKSTLRIEFDHESNEPYIEVRFPKELLAHPDANSNTERPAMQDTMLKRFIEKASWTNSRLFITYPEDGRTVVAIRCTDNPPDTAKVKEDDSVIDEHTFIDREINRMKIFAHQYSEHNTREVDDFFELLRTRAHTARL